VHPSVRLICPSVTSDKVHVRPIRVNVLLTLNRVNLDLLCLRWLPHRCHIAATLNGRRCCGRIRLAEGCIRWWRGAYVCQRGAYAGRGAHTPVGGAHTLAEGRIRLSEGCKRLSEGHIRQPPGRIRLPKGRIRLRKGRAQLPSGRIRLQFVTSEIDPYTCLNRSE
jgi:hypothetical protein